MFGIKLPTIKIGGDVGKALGAVTAPLRNTVKAVESLGRGDLNGVAGNLAHTVVGANPVSMASNASSSVKSALNHDTVNTLTLGFSKDISESADKGLTAGYGREIDSSDWSNFGRQAVRGAAVVGAVMAAPVVAGAVSGASLPSAATVGNTIAGASLLKTASENPNEALASVADKYAPGTGDVVRTIQPIQTGGARQPASVPAESIVKSSPTTVVKSNSKTGLYLALGAVGLLGVAVLYRLKK